jgi:hypothetical protein
MDQSKMKLYYRIQEETWYFLGRIAGWCWQRFSDDRASYWLDWLPAYCTGHYYQALNKRRSIEAMYDR